MRPARLLYLCVLLVACGPSFAPKAAVSPGDNIAGAIASAPRVANPPVAPPTPPGTNMPDFACADASGGKTGVANSIAARMSEQQGYDRFVLQFDSIVPTYTVKRQDGTDFTLGPSGQTVTLAGKAGVSVTVHSATGTTTFNGPTDITHPDYQVLVEARQTQDFEGYVSWGLGLSRAACMRVFTLQDPARLVVDFTTTG